MPRFSLILIYILLSPALSAQVISPRGIDTLEVEELRFSPDHARGGEYADVLANITFIPLEYSRISRVEYEPQVLILDSAVVIFNNFGLPKDRALLFYSKDGRFLKRVGDFTRMCAPCKGLRSIDGLYSDADYIYIGVYMSGSEDNVLQLDHEGNFAGTLHIEASNFLTLGDGMLQYRSPRHQDRGALIFVDKGGAQDTLVRYVEPHLIDDESHFVDIGNPFSPNGSDIYFTAPYNNLILQYSCAAELQKAYRVVLPLRYSLPRDEYGTVFTEKYHADHPEHVIAIDGVFAVDDNLLFRLHLANGSRRTFLYQKDADAWISLDNLVPDSSAHFVPILNNHHKVFAMGKDLYTFVYPSAIKQYFEQRRQTNLCTTEPVASLIKEYNPILVRFNLRK